MTGYHGKKYDGGKPRWTLVPQGPMSVVVDVMTHGAEKYGADNWELVENGRERYMNAAFRHIDSWRGGEKLDPESGLHHLGHAATCLLFVLWHELKGEKGPSYWEKMCREAECKMRALQHEVFDLKRRVEGRPLPPLEPTPEPAKLNESRVEGCGATFGGEPCVLAKGHDGWHVGKYDVSWGTVVAEDAESPVVEACGAVAGEDLANPCILSKGHEDCHGDKHDLIWYSSVGERSVDGETQL